LLFADLYNIVLGFAPRLVICSTGTHVHCTTYVIVDQSVIIVIIIIIIIIIVD